MYCDSSDDEFGQIKLLPEPTIKQLAEFERQGTFSTEQMVIAAAAAT